MDPLQTHSQVILIRHWLPIVTFCPVNHLPDLIYVTIKYRNAFAELYGVRKRVRKLVSWKKQYMEDIAQDLMEQFPNAVEVTVTLAFSRHVVTLMRAPHQIRTPAFLGMPIGKER